MFRPLNVLLASVSRRRATGRRPITAPKVQPEDRAEDSDAGTTSPKSAVGESEHGSPRREAEDGGAAQGAEEILSRDVELPIPFDNNLPQVVHDQLGPEVFRPVPDPMSLLPPADGPRWVSIRQPDEASSQSLPGSKSQIQRPQNLRFRFVADGTALLVWEEGASCIVRICLPFGEGCMRGQKLTVAAQRRRSMPSEMRVLRAAGGSKVVVAVILAQGSQFGLFCFDGNGGHSPQHGYIERSCEQNPPISLSVSRDDRRIAVGWGGVVEVFSMVNGRLDQTPMQAVEPPYKDQPHLQTNNFSVDSTELVIASQVKGRHHTRPNVYTSVHKISQDTLPTLERIYMAEPCQLQATPNARGISGVFRLENSVNPLQPSLLLTTQCEGSYATLLAANSSRRHKVIVKEKPILAAAQGPGPGYENSFVFQDNSSQIWLLDVNDRIYKTVGNFSDDRRGLGSKELKALSITGEGIVQVFWFSRDGCFVLKRIPINGQGDSVEVEDVGKLYLEILANG